MMKEGSTCVRGAEYGNELQEWGQVPLHGPSNEIQVLDHGPEVVGIARSPGYMSSSKPCQFVGQVC
eukprot:53381-Eustigmatos_ZCMA.PRE.1